MMKKHSYRIVPWLVLAFAACGGGGSGTDTTADVVENSDNGPAFDPGSPQDPGPADLPDPGQEDSDNGPAFDPGSPQDPGPADQGQGEDAFVPQTQCQGNGDCADGEWCRKDPGRCAWEGVCEEKPADCPALAAPVCGCDGKDHGNSCEAHVTGVNVMILDECKVLVRCIFHEDCGGAGWFCKKVYTCSEEGTCAKLPGSCTDDPDPVCGCDLKQYDNLCKAHAAGQNTSQPGDCGLKDACFTNKDCAADEFCMLNPNMCEGLGSCVQTPPDCQPGPLDNPVCGCDGNTYESYCLAMAAGVSTWDMNQGCVASGATCNDSAECDPDGFCWRPDGDCGGSGICHTRPEDCADMQMWSPVCGCDGQSYTTWCSPHLEGVNVASWGPCPDPGGCTKNADCSEGDYCHKAVGQCDAKGTCEPMPVDCPAVYEPVCGCDGTTYGNACGASASGMNVEIDGECDTTGLCTHNGDCQDTEFCKLKGGFVCVGNGTCEPRPEHQSCNEGELEFICGCNGSSHENPCEAYSQGFNVAYPGDCVLPCSDGSPCPEDQYCALEFNDCEGGGMCVATPASCPGLAEPACGCDGKTYSNVCYAQAAGVGILAMGECPGT